MAQREESRLKSASLELTRFYQILARVQALPGQRALLAECTGRSHKWPARGVYFFEEPGELRGDGMAPRITRIGTHAVSANSRSSLWGRLRAHRGGRDGRGNHRGSVFRQHAGLALLNRSSGVVETWAKGQTAPKVVRQHEDDHERLVSAYLGSFRLTCIAVSDEPGKASDRAFIERNAIALLSNQLDPWDAPSSGWLGHFSNSESIKRSGLWNVQHVDIVPDVSFLETFERCADGMAE